MYMIICWPVLTLAEYNCCGLKGNAQECSGGWFFCFVLNFGL